MTRLASIGFFVRSDQARKAGGDLVQAQGYMQALGRRGYATRLVAGAADVAGVDLLHVFNLDRPWDCLPVARAARQRGIPLVLSPIAHPRRSVERYQAERSFPLERRLVRLGFKASAVERGKALARNAQSRNFQSLFAAVLSSADAAKQELWGLVTGVQLLSLSERRELEEQGFSLAGKTAEVVRNGVEPVAAGEVAPGSRTADFASRHPRFAAVVGRIEPRKNQIEIARLASKHGIPLLFAGQENPRHAAYGAEFRQLIEDDDTLCHAGTLSRPEVAGLFQRAHVHVSASLFEVSPLVDLEARARGCRIVASRESHGTEFLDEYCELCDPWSSDSIERALLAAWQPQLRAPAMAVPTWDQSAEVLARMYQQILT